MIVGWQRYLLQLNTLIKDSQAMAGWMVKMIATCNLIFCISDITVH